MRREKKYHYIYKITNVLNNKYYIGMHSTDNLEDGYFGSGRKLSKAIKKYGKVNFKKEILEFLPNRSSLKEREKHLVNEDLLKDLLCMNLMIGGHGGYSEAGRLGGIKSALRTNKILKKRFKNEPLFLKAYQERGFIQAKKNWKDGKYKPVHLYGKNNGMYNKHHSIETKYKMSKNHKGKSNSQFGTCWITNGKENKKVKKENLILEKGWFLGRTIAPLV